MERRDFLRKTLGAAVTLSYLPVSAYGLSSDSVMPAESSGNKELNKHRIDGVEFTEIRMRYPRQVGKNAVKGIHGFGTTLTVATLKTDRGASGWGQLRANIKNSTAAFEMLKGKLITDFFTVEKGTFNDQAKPFDIPLHDLAGQILNKPVYKLLGAERPETAPCYSGMIYFDDLEQPDEKSGLDKILEECQFDIDYGYRQLKAKIGRGNKWLPGPEGLKRDIVVTRSIAENFPAIDILVDGNDGFTPEGIIDYLKGVEDIPLFWVEEPFPETVDKYRMLKNWIRTNGYVKYLADGEARPDMNLIAELEDLKLMDVCLYDIMSFGFTPWRNLMPVLKKKKIFVSPHNWGDLMKTIYTVHLVGAYGNAASIEGVTCYSDDVDFSNYKLAGGKYLPSELPGFGIELLKKNK